MKRILIVCLLGMGLLLPSTTITAKEFIKQRTVDLWLESDILTITSDAGTGTLVQVNIYDSHEHKVLGQALSGYTSYVDVSSLPNGTYSAHVGATLSNYNEGFTLN
jgi:hypothetical protein